MLCTNRACKCATLARCAVRPLLHIHLVEQCGIGMSTCIIMHMFLNTCQRMRQRMHCIAHPKAVTYARHFCCCCCCWSLTFHAGVRCWQSQHASACMAHHGSPAWSESQNRQLHAGLLLLLPRLKPYFPPLQLLRAAFR